MIGQVNWIRTFHVGLLLVLSFGTHQLVAQERLKGDLDGNGEVNFNDFLIFASNFDKRGGAIFDPDSWVDTVVVSRTEVIRDTVLIKPPRLLPSITVKPGGWQQPVALVQAVCEQVQNILTEPLIFALDSDIVVEHVEPEGPFIPLVRNTNGSYRIWLDTENFHFTQQVFQFSHEYGHMMSNYYQVTDYQFRWFSESLSSMASLYVLRKMHERADPTPLGGAFQFEETRFILTPGLYAEQNIPGRRMDQAEFEGWFRARLGELEGNAVNRGYNDVVAHNLIDIFETSPEAWNAVRFLNIDGPSPFKDPRDFETYLQGWYVRTPAIWQEHVVEIARRFGYYPARKPALPDTAGIS